MDILLLKTFMTVVAEGSFSAAAEAMSCVQSNVTARIRRLEDHLGQPVFERGRGGAKLTQFGWRLRRHAEDLLARVEAAERDLLDAAGEAAPFRLGAMESTAAGRLPALLRDLRAHCPRAPISVRTGPTGELLKDLWERRLDAAFLAGPVDAARFRSVLAFRERLVRVESASMQAPGPLLAFRATCSYRAKADAWLRSEGLSDTEVIEMGTFDGILGCVKAGVGFAIVPAHAIQRHVGKRDLAIEDLPEPYSRSETLLAWRLDHAVTTAHNALITLLKSSPQGAAS